jgi:hypothetical protein
MSSVPHRPPVFAPSFVTARTRSRSSSTSSLDSAESKPDKGKGKLVDGALAGSDWADHVAAPTLTYHRGPSVATLATGASDIYDYYASIEPDPVRKRFKAPFKSQLLDREVGNVRRASSLSRSWTSSS